MPGGVRGGAGGAGGTQVAALTSGPCSGPVPTDWQSAGQKSLPLLQYLSTQCHFWLIVKLTMPAFRQCIHVYSIEYIYPFIQ